MSKCLLRFFCVLLAMVAGCDDEPVASYSSSHSSEVAPAASSEKLPLPPESAAPQESSPPARIVDKTFDDLKFDIEPDAPFERSMLTDEIEAMAGGRIRIRGYMFPTFQREGIKTFVLVRDNQQCCFGPGAALFDCIRVEMQPGRFASFSDRPIAVEGTFKIDEFIIDGVHRAVFLLEGEQVK